MGRDCPKIKIRANMVYCISFSITYACVVRGGKLFMTFCMREAFATVQRLVSR